MYTIYFKHVNNVLNKNIHNYEYRLALLLVYGSVRGVHLKIFEVHDVIACPESQRSLHGQPPNLSITTLGATVSCPPLTL